MLWILLFCSVFCASLNSVLLHKLPEKSNIFAFNIICSGMWILLLLTVNGFSLKLTPNIIMWGLIYGVVQELFMFFKTQAMKNGSVSITTLIGNCSLILSTSVGVLIWKETVSIIQIIGVLFLIASFVLCTYKKAEESEKASKIWLLYCLFFFVFAASVGIIFKAFSKSCADDTEGDMMLVSAVTMLVFSGAKYLFAPKSSKRKENEFAFSKVFYIIAVISGILSCSYNRLNISLAGLFDSVIFYPCFNGGVILVSALFSIIFLREKLTFRQSAGLILGLISVVTIGIF